MNKLFIGLTILLFVLTSSPGFSADKVVVVPLSTTSNAISSSDFYRVSNSKSIAIANTYVELYVFCNSGDVATGGGFLMSGLVADYPKFHIHGNAPNGSGTGWYVGGTNNGGDNISIHAYVMCQKM